MTFAKLILGTSRRALMIRTLLGATLAVAMSVSAAERNDIGKKGLEIAKQGYFFVGQHYYTATDGTQFLANQTYVEFQIPKNLKHRYPIVMFHGGGQTGTNFMGTPDGRDGWNQFFLSAGYAGYIVDEVGRGKAPWSVDLYGPIPPAGGSPSRYCSNTARSI